MTPGNNSVFVQWLPVYPITRLIAGYKVVVFGGSNAIQPVMTKSDEFSVTVSDLLETTSYFVKVAALHEDNSTGDFSTPVKVVTGGTSKSRLCSGC